MPRLGGQSEARPPVLKSPSKLDTHLSTHCSRNERLGQSCPAGNKTGTEENAMTNAFWVSVRSNISKRWNTTENDVSKNQSSADSALRLPNTSNLNSNAAEITEYISLMYQTTLQLPNLKLKKIKFDEQI
ncbi:hypothetical protein TNCV_4137051 [Trichonephila clavipes]|nr:hypothetical protein TNCV_4137051 [Trichonephila clavipes]